MATETKEPAQAQEVDPLKDKVPHYTRIERDRALLEPLNHGFAASERKALELGVSAHAMVEMLLSHAASVVALIEPPGARARTIEQVVTEFAGLVRQHVDAKHRTKGGILVARGEL